tara:strand:- start:406 stop:3627 length:3222 start_codon:yes stop_codon:yes gene_type:complete
MFNTQFIPLLLATLCITPAYADTTIPDLVAITDINNPNDMHMGDKFGYGLVEQPYRIGKTEVTNRQYADFLNAVAASDPHQLYDEQMATHKHGGIIRHGNAGKYTYTVIKDRADQPVVFVSLLDATRYCNWLSNGKTETGVYAITTDKRFDTAFTEPAMRDLISLDGSRLYYLPHRHEWYKAGYYDPNTQTYRRITDTNRNQPSAYGTLDQVGKAREWLETPYRAYRRNIGASWDHDTDKDRNATDWRSTRSDQGDSDLGFRVAATPAVQLIGTVNDQRNYFFDGKNTGKVQLRYDGQPAEAQITWTLTDYFGKTLENQSKTITLKPGKQTAFTFTLPSVDGYYELNVTVGLNGQTLAFNPLPLVVADSPIHRPRDLHTTSFGVTGHLGKFRYDYTTFSEPDQTLELYRYAGITINRMDGPWELVIDKSHRAGVQNLIVLSPIGWTYEKWKTASTQQVIDKWAKQGIAPEFAGYAEYVFNIASEFKNQVDAWEIANEPWGRHITPEDYTQSVKVAAKALRMADPGAVILHGDTTFLGETMLQSGSGAHCDVASFHVYSYFREYFWGIPTKLRDIRKHMDTYGMAGKPIWLTETSGCGYGLHIYPGQTLAEVRHYQAMDLPKKMLASLAVGADKTFFYNFRDTPAHGTENEFGMVHTDLTPKPAFAAYRTVAKLFNSSRYMGQIDLPDAYLGYLFETDGQQQAIIWRRDTQSNELGSKLASLPTLGNPNAFDFKATGVIKQVNVMGSQQTLPVSEGKVQFNVDGYPTYILGAVDFPMRTVPSLTSKTIATHPIATANLRILPPMPVTTDMRNLEKPTRLTAAWSNPSEMTVRIFNQSAKPIRGMLKLQVPPTWLPDSWQVLTAEEQVTLPAHGSLTRVLGFKPPASNPAGITQFLLTATLTLDSGEVFADHAILNMAKDQPYRQWRLPKGKQAQGITFENKLEKGSADARLSWDDTRGSWTEIYVYPSPKLAEHSLEQLAPYTFKVRTQQPEQVRCINLRVRDSSGEVFQYRFEPKFENADWLTVRYDIANDKPQSTWGGNKDGKLDLPLMLQGLSFDFTKGEAKMGSLDLLAN